MSSPLPLHLFEANALLLRFTEKTKNTWEQRANFTPVPGKYTLISIDYGGDESPVCIKYNLFYSIFKLYI